MTAVTVGDHIDAWVDTDDQHHQLDPVLEVARSEPEVVVATALDATEAHVFFPATATGMSGSHAHTNVAAFHIVGDDPDRFHTFPLESSPK